MARRWLQEGQKEYVAQTVGLASSCGIAGSRLGSRKKRRSERSKGVEPGCDGSLGKDNSSPATIMHASSRIAQEPVGTEATDSITQFILLAQTIDILTR